MVRFKIYEHFHYKTTTGQNDDRQSLFTILYSSDWTMLILKSNQNLIQIYHVVQEL